MMYTKNEWTTILGIGGIILAMFLAFAVYSIYHKRKEKQRLLLRIRASWGAWPEREYEYQELDVISGYYQNRKQDCFQIDDITWNDLDMDRIFMLLNHTNSYMGEGYLYYLLRTPSYSEEELQKREELIRYFQDPAHTGEREQLQVFFAKAGKSKRQPIFDTIYNLADAQSGSKAHHYLMAGLIPASVIVLLINPMSGILLLLAAMFISMMDYYKKKRPVEPYVLSCGFLLRTLETAEAMEKINIPELKPYQERMHAARKTFGRLKRNTAFLIMGSRTDGDLLTAFVMYLNSCFHIDLIQFDTVVKEMKKHISEFEILIEEIGKVESAIAIASFRELMQNYTVPELKMAGTENSGKQNTVPVPFLETADLYHPLIQDPVTNSISTKRGVLLTGSNASGKSTFLKTVAINALLAQSVHTCMASSWKSSYFRVFSSMALQDNLVEQESYYIVEIKSLKRVLDRLDGKENAAPVLCFVDEVLRGTNTVERIAASSQILKYMTGSRVICFAATHDIELTHILESSYDNYHFQEEIEENDIHFDYILHSGRAVSRNAIKLLQIMGYEPEVIRQAEENAEHFLESGEWEKI
ncbi:MAG: hypothetical protein PHR92_10460 [Lachnospiraceae bacterium]|nr:hypothetical protein [Lachnospiraceae bacterium]